MTNKTKERLEVVAAIIMRNDYVFIAQRPEGKFKAGYWEFPGGKVEVGELDEEALARELKEEINIEVVESKLFSELSFNYPEMNVQLKFYKVTEFFGEPEGLENQVIKWVKRDDLLNFQFLEANLSVVNKLLAIQSSG